jgi:hypothetical protein
VLGDRLDGLEPVVETVLGETEDRLLGFVEDVRGRSLVPGGEVRDARRLFDQAAQHRLLLDDLRVVLGVHDRGRRRGARR